MSTTSTYASVGRTAPGDAPDLSSDLVPNRSSDPVTLETVLATGDLRSVFQPLVRLEDRALVGYEVLTRGPRGHRLESPLELLEEADRTGRELELDRAMLGRGLRSTLALDPDPRLTWFFNAESRVARAPLPADLRPLVQEMTDRGLPFTIEFTERSLTADPSALLTAVDRVRAAGGAVALDDVGADPASLALLPLVNPDVVKLDMRLLRQHLRRDIATITNAVRAHCEDTGAVTLAEGIETPDDVLVAQALGAKYGQGWLFGRPAEQPAPAGTVARIPFADRQAVTEARTPYEVVADLKPTALTQKRLLRPISRYLEEQLYGMRESLLLVCFQDAQFFTPRIAGRYADLAEVATFTAAIAVDLGPEPAPHVRGTCLDPDDPLRLEWNVVVVGPHFAGALVARDLGDDGPDDLRRFEYVVTHDRNAVLAAARSLVSWVTPEADLLGP